MSLIGSTLLERRSELRERCARIAIGLALMVGPIIACNNDDEYYPYSSSGFAPSKSPSASSSGYVGDAGGKELCEAVTEGISCYGGDLPSTSCEQGTNANASCNAHLLCNEKHLWEKEEPQRAVCAGSAVCPATYTESVPDDLCKRADAISLLCEYDEGTCGCGPVGGVNRSPSGFPKKDAGENDASDDGDGSTSDAGPRTYEWTCVHADRDAGCPRRRPREGIQCVRPLNCDYGSCAFEDGLRMDCYQGSWVRDFTRSEQCDQ